MANVRFISDLHFNHVNMAKRRGFKDVKQMNDYIISKWNEVVNKKDVTYILGDITMEKKEGYELLHKLKGIKHVVLGNHDMRQHITELLKYVNSVSGVINYKKKYILTHCPIHPNELDYRFSYNIHGHVHENTIKTYEWDYVNGCDKEVPHPKYKNVSCEVIDYTPKLIKEL